MAHYLQNIQTLNVKINVHFEINIMAKNINIIYVLYFTRYVISMFDITTKQ